MQWLLDIINNSFTKTIIPKQWKYALIVPIHKHGKDPSSPKSYRPISLLSCVAKVAERMLSKRIGYFLETNNLLSVNQAGFRKRLSTLEQISRVESSVRDALASKQICIVVFFDLTGAYDRVWHLGLLSKLAEVEIKGNVLK